MPQVRAAFALTWGKDHARNTELFRIAILCCRFLLNLHHADFSRSIMPETTQLPILRPQHRASRWIYRIFSTKSELGVDVAIMVALLPERFARTF